MKIEALMSKKLITLPMDSTLTKARDVFKKQNIHHLMILDDDGALIGIITDRDLYKHVSPTIGTSQETPRDTALMQKKLHQIMARSPVTSEPHQSLNEAALLFHDNHISCLPVVDKQGKPIGIITWRDILKVLALQYKKKMAS